MGDAKLTAEMYRMKNFLQSLSDDAICNMPEDNDTKRNSLIGLYAYLVHVTHYRQPWLVGSLSLRMVELTMKTSLNAMSPLALAHFGGVLVSAGCITEGCRFVLWASKPLQMLVEGHLLGYKVGQQSGDVHYSISNAHAILHTDYVAGQSFDVVQKNILDFMSKLEIHGLKLFNKYPILLLSQIMVLKEGLHMAGVAHVERFPTEDGILTEGTGPFFLVLGKVFHLSRAFLFRKMDEASRNIDISEAFAESYHQLNPHFLFGFLFEGLLSFLLARQSSDRIESANWIERVGAGKDAMLE
ncbi:LOW QUALITY PROTEIN: hypothetical protein ACHAWU_000339 [Discostella pseudostelligera]|uniref:Uncharacterized protein n=1 Tax=Discostella pseudostelligera TaxID=259834 RepID=A0ABD3MCI9_9STRA